MATVNLTTLIGRLISDVEVKQAGMQTLAKWRFAVGRSKKNPQTGAYENDPRNQLYIDCEVWAYQDAKRNLVDVASRFLKKGEQAYLSGRLVTDEWSDKTTGDKRSKIKLVVDNIELIGGKPSGDSDGGQEQPQQYGGGGEVDSSVPF